MENIDVVRVHAGGQREFLFITDRFRVIGDPGKLLVAHQVLKDALLIVKRVVIHASLSRD